MESKRKAASQSREERADSYLLYLSVTFFGKSSLLLEMCARRPHRQSQACRSNALYLTLEDLNFRELILPFHTSQRAKTAHMEPTKALDAAPINCSSLAAAHESANSNCAVHICLKSDPAFIRGVLLFSSERCTGCCSLLRDFTAGWDACSEG